MSILWGIDLGGTKVEGAVIQCGPKGSDEPVTTMRRLRVPTEADQGYHHIIDRIALVVETLEQETGLGRPQVLGIGTPGSEVPATGLMKNCNTTCLNGAPLRSDLQERMGVDIRLANDANCFALAEALHGAGRGYRSVFGVIMGTGVGGGIVFDGQLFQGPNGLTGEWGHLSIDPDGPACYCGRRGCVETFISGPAVETRHANRHGPRLSLADISAQAESDPHCMETIVWMCQQFGRAIGQVVNVLDPDVIVLGGGAGQVPQLRTIGLDQVRENVFGPEFNTPLMLPTLGDSAGVFGAAFLSH